MPARWSRRRGGRIDHVDVTLICEAPRIGPHRAAMRARIAGLLRLAEARVSVKATTTERLGFTGRGEGIAAQAVATVRLPEDAMSEHRDFCLPDELVEAARRVVEANRAAGLRLAVAESCTGGLVAAALTEIPGSSDVLEAAFVTYAERGEDGAARGQRGRRRHVRRGLDRRRLEHGAGRAEAQPAPTRRWRSPASPGPAAAARRSRWGR